MITNAEASAEHPKSLHVCAAQAAPRCVLVVAHRTPLWDSSSALRCIHLDDAYREGTSNARRWSVKRGMPRHMRRQSAESRLIAAKTLASLPIGYVASRVVLRT
jgi:hypothetical protein